MANPQLNRIVLALNHASARWTARPNGLLAWTDARRQRLLGVVIDRTDLAKMQQQQQPIVATAAAPAAFDWRSNGGKNFISPVKDQGGCGSCVSFCAVAALEALARINHARVLDASEADLHFCSSHGENCDGWWPSDALESIRSRGVTTEDRFPYFTAFTPPTPHCVLAPDRDTFATKLTEHVAVSTMASRKSWISDRGPLIAVLHVYDDFFAYGTGVYHHATGAEAGYHCVLIVGYDDAQHCWICKNSWGAGWGDAGFFRIGYGECGIDETSNDTDSHGQVLRFAAWGIRDVVLAPPSEGEFILQTGTALHETDGTFEFLLAPNRDVLAIKKSNTGTHSTEVHVLSAASGYQSFILHTGTVLHETDATFQFALAPNRDLIAIKKSGTGTSTTEVHVLSAASSYQSFVVQTGTPLHETDATFEFLMAANRDLFAIKKADTGSGSTEVHVLSAASGYQSFVQQTGTELHETDATFEFALAANRDLFAIKKSNAGTHSTEVHVLSATSGYQQFTKQTGTVLHETDATWAFELTGARELFGIKRSGTGTHTTEFHALRLP